MNMTKKHLRYFSLWAAALLSVSIFFVSDHEGTGDMKILLALGFSAVLLIFTAIAGSKLVAAGNNNASNSKAVKVSGILGGQINLVVLIMLMATADEFWSTEGNGILFVALLVSFVFSLYNFLLFSGNFEYSGNVKPGLMDWIFIVVFPALFMVYSVNSLFQQETDISSVGAPDFVLQPVGLMNEFEKNAAGANQKFIGKVIRFSGSVVEIAGDSSILMTLNAWKEGYTVNCDFDLTLKEKLSAVLQGDSVLLQCSCSGLSAPEEGMSLLSETSLEMTRCSLIENYKNNPNLGTDVEHPKETPKKKPK
jgi:hypothetical protein